MDPVNFCYWLQGYFEISRANDLPRDKVLHGLTHEKVEVIRKHLDMVFHKPTLLQDVKVLYAPFNGSC